MAVEKLGGGKDLGAQDGSRPGHHHGVWEEAEEEAADRLSLRKPEEPQLLGLQIFLLRVPRDPQCCRCVYTNIYGYVWHFCRVMLLNSYFQVRCSWWIAFSTAHFSLLELKSYHLRREIKKIGSIPWWDRKTKRRMNLIENQNHLSFWHQKDLGCRNSASVDSIFHWISMEGETGRIEC